MQTNVRLIDANALLLELYSMESMDEYYSDWFKNLIKSAPTVETTDDVLDSIWVRNWLKVAVVLESPLGFKKSIAFRFDNDISYPHSKPVEGKTPLEAVKRLEESLNPK